MNAMREGKGMNMIQKLMVFSVGAALALLAILSDRPAMADNNQTASNTRAIRLSLGAITTSDTAVKLSLGAVKTDTAAIRLSLDAVAGVQTDTAAIRLSLGNMHTFTSQTFSLAAAATGTPLTLAAPASSFAFQVAGVAGTLLVWDAVMEGSLDGVTYTSLITHTISDGEGKTKWTADKPVTFLRSRMIMLTLGDGTGAHMNLIGKQ